MTMVLSKADTAAIKLASTTPYQLDPAQTLRAAKALLKQMQEAQNKRTTSSGKASLLADSEEVQDVEPVWLNVTTKKHVSDKHNLKPGKIVVPHPLFSSQPSADGAPSVKVCLITADPQRTYKDLVEHPNFTPETRSKIARVIGVKKLKERYKSFESRRQLVAEYDVFLADDRIVTRLPILLGKTFYHGGNKRPIPVSLMGKKDGTDSKGEKRVALAKGGTKATYQQPKPETIAKAIEEALGAAYVHLSPGTNTSVKVGTTAFSAQEVKENIEAVVEGLTTKFVPGKWRNIKGLHVKGPRTAALPIWLASELWENDEDVLEQDLVLSSRPRSKKRKATGLAAFEAQDAATGANGEAVDAVAGKKRRTEASEEEVQDKAEQKARKETRSKRKAEAFKEVMASA